MQWAVDWPTRRALIPDLVGRDLTMNAVALEVGVAERHTHRRSADRGRADRLRQPAAAFGVMAGLYVVEIILLKLMPLAAATAAG